MADASLTLWWPPQQALLVRRQTRFTAFATHKAMIAFEQLVRQRHTRVLVDTLPKPTRLINKQRQKNKITTIAHRLVKPVGTHSALNHRCVFFVIIRFAAPTEERLEVVARLVAVAHVDWRAGLFCAQRTSSQIARSAVTSA